MIAKYSKAIGTVVGLAAGWLVSHFGLSDGTGPGLTAAVMTIVTVAGTIFSPANGD